MPYIKKEDRLKFDKSLEFLPAFESAGELNYFITKVVKSYWDQRRTRYQHVAEITGVLENVKQEFYRRLAGPYEDLKISENGDVY